MKNLILLLSFSFSIVNLCFCQNYIPGESYFGQNDYIEFIAGNLPVVISAPHGGGLEPAGIPDRDCTGCVYVRDSRTEELIREMSVAIFEEFGCYPYVIINRLHRKKLDANRDIGDAADGNALAEQAWFEFHDFIEAAKDSITQNFGKGLYLDLHGHGHDIQRLELGYRISKSELQMSDLELDAFADDASIKYLTSNNLNNLTLSQLLRGEDSFGEYYEEESFPAVPSQADPFPIGTEPYFSGGYNTERHGSKLGGEIDGIQIECNWEGVRNTQANRTVFAQATAQVVRKYFEAHYFGMGFLDGNCNLVSNQNLLTEDNELGVRIFPNPTSDKLNIELTSIVIPEFSITIFNDIGQVVFEKRYVGSSFQSIDISGFNSGIYFLKVKTKKGVEMEKIIKLDD